MVSVGMKTSVLVGVLILCLVDRRLCDDGPRTDVPEVETSLGTIRGRVIVSAPGGVEVEQYMGIPFALPPVGPRRFTNPEPSGEFPGGSYDAFDPTPSCLQVDTPAPPDVGPQSEDCLHLNVWSPRPRRHGRAVMVWIYGGGFNVGSAMIPTYNGSTLAAHGDVIYVAMNYRLAMLGFFHTGDDRMANSNFGLLDQQLALRWVHDHISAFGGNPARVTIFGESAGGASVGHQLLLPGNEGLFQRAILQSGDSVADWAWDRLDRRVELSVQSIANNANCTNDDTLLDCLREIDGETLLQVYFSSQLVSSSPKVDGVTLLDEPEALLLSGEFAQVDIIVGYVQDEGSLFIFFIPGVTPEILYGPDPFQAFINAAWTLASVKDQSEEEIEAIIEGYMPADNSTETVRQTLVNMYTDNRFLCPGEYTAKRFSEHGLKVYEYLITVRSSLADNFYPDWFGVPHGDDIQWVLGWPFFLEEDTGHIWTDAEKQFSLEVMDLWVRFAKYGCPGVTGSRGATSGRGGATGGRGGVTDEGTGGQGGATVEAPGGHAGATRGHGGSNGVNGLPEPGVVHLGLEGLSAFSPPAQGVRSAGKGRGRALWTPWTPRGPSYLEMAGQGNFTMFRETSARPGKCALWRF